MCEMGLEKPQFIGWQHHVLDRMVKHVLDFYICSKTTKSSLDFKFLEEITKHYIELQNSCTAEVQLVITNNPGWRDDFRFLYELCSAFRYY